MSLHLDSHIKNSFTYSGIIPPSKNAINAMNAFSKNGLMNPKALSTISNIRTSLYCDFTINLIENEKKSTISRAISHN